MPSSCIHGFADGQCAACRTCPHGLTTARCGRCIADAAAASRRPTSAVRRAEAEAPVPEPEERDGWEIFYDPAVSGWQVRGPEARLMPDSYRSLFLARKAVDAFVAKPPAESRSSKPVR